MLSANLIRIGVASMVLWPVLGEARRISTAGLPEDLEPKASLICNGTVLSVGGAMVKRNFQYPDVSPSWHSEEVVMLARIKVLHVFKGQAPAIIEFRYRVLAPSPGTTVENDGPNHVDLHKDGRYRFFLDPDGGLGGYIGVLDGKYDDNFAVETLAPTESDDNPYPKKETAIKFALDQMGTKKPSEKFDLSRTFVHCWPEVDGGATWRVMLYDLPDSNSSTYSSVFVHADSTINETITKLNERGDN